jgi:hypothetical protein
MLCDITLAGKDNCDPLMMADFLAHATYTSQLRVIAGAQPLGPGPVARGETGVTHLQFSPGGLTNVKAALIAEIAQKRVR